MKGDQMKLQTVLSGNTLLVLKHLARSQSANLRTYQGSLKPAAESSAIAPRITQPRSRQPSLDYYDYYTKFLVVVVVVVDVEHRKFELDIQLVRSFYPKIHNVNLKWPPSPH